MKVCTLTIRDMASVQEITRALILNGYMVQSVAVHKEYPREQSIDFFKIAVYDERAQ